MPIPQHRSASLPHLSRRTKTAQKHSPGLYAINSTELLTTWQFMPTNEFSVQVMTRIDYLLESFNSGWSIFDCFLVLLNSPPPCINCYTIPDFGFVPNRCLGTSMWSIRFRTRFCTLYSIDPFVYVSPGWRISADSSRSLLNSDAKMFRPLSTRLCNADWLKLRNDQRPSGRGCLKRLNESAKMFRCPRICDTSRKIWNRWKMSKSLPSHGMQDQRLLSVA